MARLKPLTQAQKIAQRRMAKDGVKVAEGVSADNAVEAWYRREMLAYLTEMQTDISKTLYPQLRALEDQFTADGFKRTLDNFVDTFSTTLAGLRSRWLLTNKQALALAAQFVGRMDKKTKQQLEKSVGKAMGVDLAQLVKSEGLSAALDASIRENARRITSIPAEFLDKIQRIVYAETIKGRSGASIISQIQEVYPVSQNQARLIARDQSNKVNGDITRERQTASGIRGYRWRTVGDDAVRESHKERNGKVYAWRPEDVGKRLDSGEVMLDPEAEDIGHPGEDIQCRCIAEPILELDRLI